MKETIKVLKALSEGKTVRVGNSVFRMNNGVIFSAMKHHLNDSPTGKKYISEDHRSMNDFIQKCESEEIIIK